MAARIYNKDKVPAGYIVGLGRDYPYPPIAHLYQGEYHNLQGPMCKYGANRDDGDSFSVWRGNVGKNGICKTCMKRARQGINHIWKEEENAKNAAENSENTGLPTGNK